ncbi:hypothetical protein KBD45_02230 [Candidatus Dojkabacteria bacterium]|nr:hypothetical protein [Candidatus Dojkabacteria bacterium]
MTIDQIRKGIIISAVCATLSGAGLVVMMVGTNNQEPEIVATDSGSQLNETPIEEIEGVETLSEQTQANFIQYKAIFERALSTLIEKKTVEFYETRLNESRIRYYYQVDYRNKRYYKYSEYNVEDFASMSELEKKLDVVKEVYIDGVFYIVDTKGFTKVSESSDKKFENSIVQLNELKADLTKYFELYEKSNGMVSVMDISKSNIADPLRTRYGFQSQELGDAVIIIDDKFDIWQISIDFKGNYSTFVFENFNTDLNILPIEEGVDLNLIPNPSVSPSPIPSPEVSPTISPIAEPSVLPTVSVLPTQVLGASDSVVTPPAALSTPTTSEFSLTGNCGRNKGTCYLEYKVGEYAKKITLDLCNSDCESRTIILSLLDDQYQYIVVGWRENTGYTKLFRFDRKLEKLQVVDSYSQNLITGFDITKIDTMISIKLADYNEGCDKVKTVGLYCVGNLNKMSENDVKKIEEYINKISVFYNTYIQPFKS